MDFLLHSGMLCGNDDFHLGDSSAKKNPVKTWKGMNEAHRCRSKSIAIASAEGRGSSA